jgi:hypothetical protein
VFRNRDVAEPVNNSTALDHLTAADDTAAILKARKQFMSTPAAPVSNAPGSRRRAYTHRRIDITMLETARAGCR